MSHLWQLSFTGTEEGNKMWAAEILKRIMEGGDGDDNFGLGPMITGKERPFQLGRGEDWVGIKEGNRVRAIVVTPILEGRVRYQAKVDELLAQVREWIPGCETQTATYEQHSTDTIEGVIERQKTSPEGKVLLQYDPRDHLVPIPQSDGKVCDTWKSRVRVYVGLEEWPVYVDEWNMPLTGSFKQPEKAPAPPGGPRGFVRQESDNETLACRNLEPCSPKCLECTPPSPLEPLDMGNTSLVRRKLADPVSPDGLCLLFARFPSSLRKIVLTFATHRTPT